MAYSYRQIFLPYAFIVLGGEELRLGNLSMD